MATKFTEIYNRAMFRFADYEFLLIDANKRDEILRNFLMSAQADFVHSCAVDLTDYDLEKGQYNVELGDEEQEILALGVAYYWLSNRVINSEHLHNIMARKDYNTYSPANLLREMSSIRETLRKEFRGKINEYSFRHGDANGTVDKLKVGSNK